MSVELILMFVLGASVGSFLNVIIYRYHTGFDVGGRSICLYCGKELRWYELVPILSFLYLRGRCGTCRSRLSIQYPLVELATAASFVFAYISARTLFEGGELFSYLTLIFLSVCTLIVIAAYDIRHTIVPDAMAFLLGFLGLLRIVMFPLAGEAPYEALFAGPLLAFPFALLFFFSKGRLMGFGDAKLALGLGWLLGLSSGIAALFIAFWAGGLVAAVLLFAERGRVTMKSEIPFAPFLAFGALLSLFFAKELLLPFIFI